MTSIPMNQCLECGMLCTLKCIISKVFFKGVINKISLRIFSINLWNVTNQVCFKGNIHFNFWSNPHFIRPDRDSKPVGAFKIPDCGSKLVDIFIRPNYGSKATGAFKRLDCGS